MMKSKAELKRAHILKAAAEFVHHHEFNALTLDAVAEQAGISKGGLLYHFPSKEALYQGLAEHIFEEFVQQIDVKAKLDAVEKGKWSRSLIHTSVADLDQNSELNVGLYAASMLNPELTSKISSSYRDIQEKIEADGIDPVKATLIRLAVDGLYYSEMFNIAPIDEQMRQDVIKRLLEMTTEESN